MKKSLLTLCTLAVGVTFASCSGGDNQLTENYNIDLANLITDTHANCESTIALSNYAFNYDYTNQTMQLRVSGLPIDGTSYSFISADDIKFTETNYNQGTVKKFAIPTMSSLSSSVVATGLSGEVSTAYNYNPVLNVISQVWRRFMISYTVDNRYTVQTFEKTTYWKGTTNTSYVFQGAHKEFSSSEPVYGIDMDIEKKTATLLIFNARFAEEMNVSIEVMKIEGLKISASLGQYTVEGTDLIPEVKEGSGWTKNPKYTFNTFKLVTTDANLTRGSISFTVADTFQGSANVQSTL